MPSLTTRTPSPSANHKLISELPVIDTPSPPFASKDSPWSTAILDATKLPPASRNRELVKLANNKLSNGYALFVHYVKPTLDIRRRALVDSGATKKKFHKTVGKLYEELPTSQKAFWNSEAARLRHYIQEKTITHEECVRSVGTPDQWATYIHYAETAVAEYLHLPLPAVAEYQPLPLPAAAMPPSQDNFKYSHDGDKTAYTAMSMTIATPPSPQPPPTLSDQPLLDTLPEVFTFQPRMLYGHFAHYNLDEILTTATRKRQLEKLHQLADLFDQTGKVLFYYYVYPRLWKRLRPLEVDESIATFAQEMWHYAEGGVLEEWKVAEVEVKKMLGDGNLRGLAMLRLDSLDPEVLRLHEMAEEAVSGRLRGLERSM